MAKVIQIAVTDPGYETMFLHDDGTMIRRFLKYDKAQDKNEYVSEPFTLPSPDQAG